MTLSHFNRLCEKEQRNALLYNGVLIAKRNYSSYTITLFQLNNFYIEIWCTKKGHDIGLVRAFDSTDELDPYLHDINVGELLEQ